MDIQDSVRQLQKFIRILVEAGISDRKQYSEWKKREGSEALMEECFGYRKGEKMPSITALLAPYFHKTLPLIGLNYSGVAHNTLFAFPDGWTPALRLCRGIIFDREANLVAKAFPKFFNFGEHPETTDLPDEPFVVTEKMDGHLGIIFAYDGALHLATRVSFHGPTATLGGEMLADLVRKHPDRWVPLRMRNTTTLVEIIHPKTKVHVKYGRKRGFTLIGLYVHPKGPSGGYRIEDFAHHDLVAAGKLLGLPVVRAWPEITDAQLRTLMRDKKIRNREGGVRRYQSGLRVKDKFESYIGLMVESKLSYGYLMNRMIAGNLDKMIRTLDAEIRPKADEMVSAIRKASRFRDEKKRREYLYALDKKKQKNSYYRGICRKYLKLCAAKAANQA